MSDDFVEWLREQKESAQQEYRSDTTHSLGDQYDLGRYHVYRTVLNEYIERNSDEGTDSE